MSENMVKDFADVPQKFVKEGTQFINRCTKPTQKEYIQLCRAVAVGFAVMGFIGYFVKLVHIPINQILVPFTVPFLSGLTINPIYLTKRYLHIRRDYGEINLTVGGSRTT